MERMTELPLSKLWKGDGGEEGLGGGRRCRLGRRLWLGDTRRPGCVPNRLVCHALSSRDNKAANSPCARAAPSLCARVTQSPDARPCVSLCVMDACVHLIIPLIAHSGINIPYRETQCKVNLCVCVCVFELPTRRIHLCSGIQSIWPQSVRLHYL